MNRAGRLWAKRRLRTVALFALELGVQTVNLVRAPGLQGRAPQAPAGPLQSFKYQERLLHLHFPPPRTHPTPPHPPPTSQGFYLAPNAFVLANACSWFLIPVHVFSMIRWTCLNTVGLLGWG